MMVSFYFHEYTGATYNRADFDAFCEEWGYKAEEDSREFDERAGGGYTCFISDEQTALILHCHFPHNVTMGYPVQA